MIVGCPTEIKSNEYRVGLTPAAVSEYVRNNHQVFIETKAGLGIGAQDSDYERVGARVVATATEIFSSADLVVKVKEPQPSEWVQLREGQILYTYLHLAADVEQTKGLLDSGCVAIAYETITDDKGGLPLLAPMSEVAGRLSIQAAAHSLEKENKGKGLLLGGVPGVASAKVVIIGAGVVGLNAAKMAVGMGASVVILDSSLTALRNVDDLFRGQVRTIFSNAENLLESVVGADVVIGSVLIPGAKTPKLVTKEMIKLMSSGSCVVDVAIDQGGCFETSKPTTHADPTYVVDDVVHYCVSNMPGAVPRTSTYALNNATLTQGIRLANCGLKALADDKSLRNGLNICEGKVSNQFVADALQETISFKRVNVDSLVF